MEEKPKDIQFNFRITGKKQTKPVEPFLDQKGNQVWDGVHKPLGLGEFVSEETVDRCLAGLKKNFPDWKFRKQKI